MEQCKKVLGELDCVELLVVEGCYKVIGYLIVLVLVVFGCKYVVLYVLDFLCVNFDVCILFNLIDCVVDFVCEGYDVGICIGGVIDLNFVVICLVLNKCVVCGMFVYFVKYGVLCMLDDFVCYNCFVFNLQGGQQCGWYFQQNGKVVIVKVNGNFDCNDGELLYCWMGEGLGLGWCLMWEIQFELEFGVLMMVFDDYVLFDYDIFVVYLQQWLVLVKIWFFIEYLKMVYGQVGYWL